MVQDVLMDVRMTSVSRWVYQPLVLYGFCGFMLDVCEALDDFYRKNEGMGQVAALYPTKEDMWDRLNSDQK